MRTRIEMTSLDKQEVLTVEIGNTPIWNDNVVISKRGNYKDSGATQIGFELNAETARALSFAFGELAKVLGKQKC